MYDKNILSQTILVSLNHTALTRFFLSVLNFVHSANMLGPQPVTRVSV